MEHYDINKLREKAKTHSLSAKELEIYNHTRIELGNRDEDNKYAGVGEG